MKSQLPRKIELLSPARDAAVAREAILHGADAVYIGAEAFGARASACNSTESIAGVCDFAHQFGARVYCTVNTIIYDHELKRVERLIASLYRVGVDAVITQDPAILRLNIPPIAVHASTQCDLRTPDKARFLAALGYSQMVMARELTLDEMAAIHAAVPHVRLEAFVHGALCVSYSGRCQVSQMLKGRSANRGECAQICRLCYDLVDCSGRTWVKGRHLLSLCDFNASGRLEQMLQAGVSSFKIEGRLKDAAYVKNVTAYYRQALDRIISSRPELYVRASVGESSYTFTPRLLKSFNRTFTTYFIDSRRPPNGYSMAATDSPKSHGEPLGCVTSVHGNVVRIDTRVKLANGDGLSYVNQRGEWAGVRVNRVQGADVILREAALVRCGDMVYRTHDKAFGDLLDKPSAKRTVWIDASLWQAEGILALKIEDERGNRVVHSLACSALAPAHTPQGQRQTEVLARLGGTIYQLRHVHVLPELFVPSSLLANLRREAIAALDRAQKLTFVRPLRHPEEDRAPIWETNLTYADNVANHLSAQLYRDHGARSIEPPLELAGGDWHTETHPVMHTRYCLRRQLGVCRLDRNASQLPAELYLRSGSVILRVECDCRLCEMRLYIAQR